MKGCNGTARLSAVSLGVAFGFVTGLSMLLFAWIVLWSGKDSTIITQWAQLLPGYGATISGGLIGAVWGFVEGFICGLLTGWIYNLCVCCCKCLCCKSSSTSCDIK